MFTYYLTKFKWVITAIGAVASLCSIGYYVDQNGYNRAVVAMQSTSAKIVKEATDKAVKKAHAEMQEALTKQKELHDFDLVRLSNEREVQVKIEKVIEYVDKVTVIKEECAIADDSVVRVLNESINYSNRSSN